MTDTETKTALDTYSALYKRAHAQHKAGEVAWRKLVLPSPPAKHPLILLGITATVELRPAETRTVWADDGDGGAEEAEAAWEDHGQRTGAFGAAVAQASSRPAATRTIMIREAVLGAHVPAVVAEVGERSLEAAAWMLVTFGADEILAMRALAGPDFAQRILDAYRERPRTEYVMTAAV